MTTLLLSENFPPVIGGTPRWFWELYRRMPRSAVVIAAGACPGDGAFDQTHDLRVHRVPLTFANPGAFSIGNCKRHGAAIREIRRHVRRDAVQQVHCGRVLPEGWLAWRCGAAFACFVHGEELHSMGTSRELTWMARRVLRATRCVFANCRHTAGLLQRDWSVPESKLRVLHPGVDTRRFVPAAPDAAARAALAWSGRTVLLTVSRLQKRKGHDRMIEAVGMLRQPFPSVLYAIAGDGEERGALEEQVRRAGLTEYVQFHGALDEAALLHAYQQCDLFVLPNRSVAGDFEGFGMVLLEAQACGRPVIAGASGGTAEAVRAGETGLIVDCTQPAALATAVTGLLHDLPLRQRMGAEGRRWVEDCFDFDTRASMSARLLEIGDA
ncbi:MAG TPA: glycosyltransferase family 4 protein [Candidatus Acidoferrales bacterium]|nr:glycosyltransferase family 4 protein [Candidatus Acidoferrales bacterium]